MRHGEDVYFVGLDLAWGEKNQSGVAVLDADGTLKDVGAALHDDEIIEAISPFVNGDCLVAIDAPLIVTNASGQRSAERALNAHFGGFDAGAHSANTGIPVFSSGLRGARIAGALGLDVHPQSTGSRRAIEVYPHPATIVLFRLGRTLKYKAKRNRTLGLLKSELLRLMFLLEELAEADVTLHVRDHPQWMRLRRLVQNATTKAELRRCEDPVDAVVCAYIARFATARPHDMTVYGDADAGYIVTPTLPPDARPTPRQRAYESFDDDEPLLRALRRAADALQAAELAVHVAVAQCRANGHSWAVIGDALGLSDDECERRFS
jgi:predicted RNase H-like nuclease